MAGHWRSAQRRKRWTDHAAQLPDGALDVLEPWPALAEFRKQLESFGVQPSTYAQLARVKSLGNALLEALQLGSKEEVGVVLRVFSELLFVENSRPLHRGLLSTLSRVAACHSDSVQNAFRECCRLYGPAGAKERRFGVVGVSASMVSLPQPGLMKEVTHLCAPSMANSLCIDVQSILCHALDGGRPTPNAMEECQDALSSIYYFLQQFPDKFIDEKYLCTNASEKNGLASYSNGNSTIRFESAQNVRSVGSAKENTARDEVLRYSGFGRSIDSNCRSVPALSFGKEGLKDNSDRKLTGNCESRYHALSSWREEGIGVPARSDSGNPKIRKCAHQEYTSTENSIGIDPNPSSSKGSAGNSYGGFDINVTSSGDGNVLSENLRNSILMESANELNASIASNLRGFRSIGSKKDFSTNGAGEVCGAIVCCLLDVLQTGLLSRDCLVAAGVGLAAAVQLCSSQEGLALVLASTAFPSLHSTFSVLSTGQGISDAPGQRGIMERVLVDHRNSNLRAELDALSDFGKLCYFRGLLTAISRGTQNVHLLRICNGSNNVHSGFASGQNPCGDREPQMQAWTLLYDGVLPALCRFCESSVDSHFKFHAVTALQICLQQIKTSICGQVTNSAFKDFQKTAIRFNLSIQNYDPLPGAVINQVLHLIWNNWEDPLTQTVKQVQVVFDLLVDVQLVHKRELCVVQQAQSNELNSSEIIKNKTDEVGSDDFLQQIANDLLAAGRYRKGKYVPLASLVLRVGARKMLLMSPDLLFQTIDAFSDDDVCSSASTFLKIFLERLKEECWSAEGVMEGTVAARRFWIPAVLSGLLSGDPRLRNNLTIYSLPVVMNIDPDSLLVVLGYILDWRNNPNAIEAEHLWQELEGYQGLPDNLSVEQQVVLLISFLKVARSLALVEGSIDHRMKPSGEVNVKCSDGEGENTMISNKMLRALSYAVFCIRRRSVEVPVGLLVMALTHKEDGLRVDAAELMCLNPKTASMPSPIELCFLRVALPLNMRCSSTAFRMRWTSFLKKFFLRVRTAVERQQKMAIARKIQLNPTESLHSLNCTKSAQEAARFKPTVSITSKGDTEEENVSNSGVTLEEMEEFMQWLTQMLVSSLYPSAPYERKSMAMELFNAIIEVWSLKESLEKRFTLHPHLDNRLFSPYPDCLLSDDFSLVVVGAVVDSWDKLREGAFRILVQYPTPLPGLDSGGKIEELVQWAKGMVNSPRVRESDAGALALRLIFRKYVLDLGWIVKIHPDPKVIVTSAGAGDSSLEQGLGEVLVKYVESLNDWLQWGIEEGDNDLLKACSHSFVHGVLLVLRYTVEETDWTSPCVQSCTEGIRAAFARLISLLLRVIALSLWVVSADALNLQEKMGGSSVDKITAELDDMTSDIGPLDDDYDSDVEGSLAPVEQMVMVGCWLSVKEVSLLLGTMARKLPLPGSPVDSKREKAGVHELNLALTLVKDPCALLDREQLEAIGNQFVQVLLSMKHNGAIDKTRAGFIALCDRLLRSNDPWLNKLPEVWLHQLMKHTGAKGQVVDDLLRRSAGIPPAFLALFLAEPDGSPKKLLPVAMHWLIDRCKTFVNEHDSQRKDSDSELSKFHEGENHLSPQTYPVVPVCEMSAKGYTELGDTGLPIALKLRDEGVVPTVHAFNILRMTFHDTNLATDTSGYCAVGLITAIQAFASSHWEVRNSATLAFTALVHRTIGFLNVYKRESARRAITGFEFFHRYPTLHLFLLKELQSATWQLQHGKHDKSSQGNRSASVLHPSLGPVLMILSRLKPSFINSDVEDWLNPSAFMPFVTLCATQKNLHVRVLASRALSPLVSSEDLPRVLVLLAQSLPITSMTTGLEFVTTDEELAGSPADASVHGSPLSGFGKAASYNAIHGVLLQMHTLLTCNCLSLPDVVQCLKIATEVHELVEKRLWLGSINHCGCYIVIAAFLDMLGGLLSVAKACQTKLPNSQSLINRLQSLVTELSGACLDDSIQHTRLLDSTKIGLRETAARLYFETILTRVALHCMHQTSKLELESEDKHITRRLQTRINQNENGGLGIEGNDTSSLTVWGDFGLCVTRLRHALVDNSYEVRLATLKVLKKYCNQWAQLEKSNKTAGRGIEDQSNSLSFLRPLIISRLSVEKHPLCIQRILQVIYAWTLLDKRNKGLAFVCHDHSDNLGRDSVWDSGLSAQELWFNILNIYHLSKQIKTKEVAMRCLGGCVHLLRSGFANFIGPTNWGESPSSELYAELNAPENGGNQILDSAQGSDKIKEVMTTWLGLIKIHSEASEPVNFRRASAEAIMASGLLEDTKMVGLKLSQKLQGIDVAGKCTSLEQCLDLEWYSRAILSAWCMCIKLLEDEDFELRQNLSLSVSNVIANSDMQVTSIVPAQVERVIQTSFEFLSLHFGCWSKYYEVLAEWVLTSDDDDVIGGNPHLTTSRLFDKEIDNHHEEELLFVQLCCLQLRNFIHISRSQVVHSDGGQPKSVMTLLGKANNTNFCLDGGVLEDTRHGSWFKAFLWKWRKKYLDQANIFAQFSLQRESVMRLVGVTSHQHTFKMLYRSLLGLLIFADSIDGRDSVTQHNSNVEEDFVCGLAKLSDLLKKIPMSPLVSNLLFRVLVAYELELQVTLDSFQIRSELNNGFCESFDPLFLIS